MRDVASRGCSGSAARSTSTTEPLPSCATNNVALQAARSSRKSADSSSAAASYDPRRRPGNSDARPANARSSRSVKGNGAVAGKRVRRSWRMAPLEPSTPVSPGWNSREADYLGGDGEPLPIRLCVEPGTERDSRLVGPVCIHYEDLRVLTGDETHESDLLSVG